MTSTSSHKSVTAQTAASSTTTPTTSSSTSSSSSSSSIGINFPPVKSQEEVAAESLPRGRAHVSQEEAYRSMAGNDTPPVIRSVLEMAHVLVTGHSQLLRAAPGYHGGVLYKGRPFCFAAGYRDSSRPLHMDDKGNHMKLRDPLVYGGLSAPIASAYLCELHGKGTIDLHAPVVAHVPELEPLLPPQLSLRDLLRFQHVIHDGALLADAGASPWRVLCSPNACAAAQIYIHAPVARFLSASAASHDGPVQSGAVQRQHLIHYLRSSPRGAAGLLRRRPARMARFSHTTFALAIAAVERQLGGTSFEDAIRTHFFEKAQCHGAGYGPPKVWRDPSELFYRPTGMALQHNTFSAPVASGAAENAGAAVWNASLNLYAPPEEYAKLLLLGIDAIHGASTKLPQHPLEDGGALVRGYELGVFRDVRRHRWIGRRSILGGVIDTIPSATSFDYRWEDDVGCFSIASCGSRGARLFATNVTRMMHHLFHKHILRAGIDALAPDQPNPTKEEGGKDDGQTMKFQRVLDSQRVERAWKNHDVHTRF